jgi:hypothetical protein
MKVHGKINAIAVQTPADNLSELTQRNKVIGFVKPYAVFKTQALARLDFFVNVGE